MPVTRAEIGDHVRAAFALGPARTETLVSVAAHSHARREVLEVLRRLPNHRYHDLADLWRDLPDLPIDHDDEPRR